MLKTTDPTALSLPAGAELDKIVAVDVMGWRAAGFMWPYPCCGTGTACNGDVVLLLWRSQESGGAVWSPSTDIAAAMEVVGEMRKRGGIFTMSNPLDHQGWDVEIYSPGRGRTWQAHADTLPVAICLCAIKVAAAQQGEA